MPDHDLRRHTQSVEAVAVAPVRAGNRIVLLPEAMTALRAMFDAMRAARSLIAMEYYTFEDVEVDGASLCALLRERIAAGVCVAIIYDAIGSDHTPESFFDQLRTAGAILVEYHGLDPFRRFFSLAVDDRDHRKILVVDDRIAFLGGVNLDRQYMNPPSAGAPPETRRAFWQDAAVSLEGPIVADIRAIFNDTWQRQDGERLPVSAVTLEPLADGELACVEGSAPHQGRPLHTRAVLAAIRQARASIWLATGYFVPMPDEILALRRAASRGVAVRLLLPGVSDVPGAVHAGRATYGRLLRAGVIIREMHDAVLHAKVATIDSVWSSVGSSNLDRRSARLNNEVDAVILGERTAGSVETMLHGWFEASREITLDGWSGRSWREHASEAATLLWRRLM